jgi:hypothetical protein
MLIAAGMAFALLTASAIETMPFGVPPITVDVTAAVDIPRQLVDAALAEAQAVWRAAGVRLIWNRLPAVLPSTLNVVIGGGLSPIADEARPLGWIALDGETKPTPKIYVSHGNAVQLLASSGPYMGPLEKMPTVQRQLYLSRAMGRALAHEIGHYLLASKQHTRAGLMSAIHSSTEFFGPSRGYFKIDSEQRQLIAARFTSLYIASQQ